MALRLGVDEETAQKIADEGAKALEGKQEAVVRVNNTPYKVVRNADGTVAVSLIPVGGGSPTEMEETAITLARNIAQAQKDGTLATQIDTIFGREGQSAVDSLLPSLLPELMSPTNTGGVRVVDRKAVLLSYNAPKDSPVALAARAASRAGKPVIVIDVDSGVDEEGVKTEFGLVRLPIIFHIDDLLSDDALDAKAGNLRFGEVLAMVDEQTSQKIASLVGSQGVLLATPQGTITYDKLRALLTGA